MSSVALVLVCELMTHLPTMPGSTNHVICKREKQNISEDAGYRESGENSPTQTEGITKPLATSTDSSYLIHSV